jgi:hypothetical protein
MTPRYPLTEALGVQVRTLASVDRVLKGAEYDAVLVSDLECILALQATERWRECVNFPGYEVSSFGRVKSKKLHRPMALRRGKYGYLRARLWRDGNLTWVFAHKLVLEAFVGKCPEGMQAGHLDGKSDNNNLANLKWITPKENSAHKKLHGTDQSGERHPMAVLSEDEVAYIRNNFVRVSDRVSNARELGKMFGVSPAHICGIVRGDSWLSKSDTAESLLRELVDGVSQEQLRSLRDRARGLLGGKGEGL